MQYDNRLRVSQHQVASGEYSGGYMKKAEFVYYSDSKPKEMDNQVDAVFDRKFEYDFAGRLSRSEFGLYTTQNNGDVNPHMQDLTYDGFSHMNSRATEQWGASSGFAREFVNERMTAGSGETLTYDAAGNVTYSGTSSNKFQDTVFDSAGRRTGFTERWSTVSGSYSPIISERISTVEYDGDGRVVAGTIQQNRISSPTSTGAVGNSYTVHSTVLGGVLSELNYSGANRIPRKTHVYAGGAIIAEQRLLTGQDDKVVYLHADPVTGSRAEVGQSGELVSDQQFEPLGQRIRTNPPIEEQAPSVPPPAIGDSLFPEWQCMIPRDEGNGAFIPRHCSQAAEQQDIFWYEVRWEKKGNPARIHAAAQRNEGPSYQDELNTQVAATDKPDDGAEDCPKDKNGFVIQPCVVNGSGPDLAELDPPTKDDDLGKWLDFIFRKAVPLVADRVKIIGLTESQERSVTTALAFMIISSDCVNTFKAAKKDFPQIKTPAESIRDQGLVIASSSLLLSSANNVRLGISESERSEWVGRRQFKVDAFSVAPSADRPIYTFYNFWTPSNFPLTETNVHEQIHRSNVPGGFSYSLYDLFFGHDLSWFSHYDSIVAKCTPPAEK